MKIPYPEKIIFECLAKGMTIKEIEALTSMSSSVISKRTHNFRLKYGFKNNEQTVIELFKAGLIDV